MRRFLPLFIRIVLWIVLSYKLGILLVRYIDARVHETPRWLELTVRFALKISGYGDVQDPETIGALCGLFVLSLCWISVAVGLLGLYRLFTRFRMSRH
jgi:uncharacterized protein involved in cysteine biosynthesis